MTKPLRIEVWSDIICPWCAIGRVRLRKALEQAGIQAEVVHRAFELDPRRTTTVPTHEYLAERYGSAADVEAMTQRVRELARTDGLTLRTDAALAANTFDAHRLLQWAQSRGKGEACMDRLVAAHFEELLDLSDPVVLRGVGMALGFGAEEVDELLASDAFAASVRADEEQARILGINGVPFFLLAERFGLSGAQPVEMFLQAIAMAQSDTE